MSFDRASLTQRLEQGPFVRVLIATAVGSTPREAGTSMIVGFDTEIGTIGGGALEKDAITKARTVLLTGKAAVEVIALGPTLGQCCGGSVTLIWERLSERDLLGSGPSLRRINGDVMPSEALRRRSHGITKGSAPIFAEGWIIEAEPLERRQVWIWGAGHVGRALVKVLAPLPNLDISWIDTASERFPVQRPTGVEIVVASDPTKLVQFTPQTAEHIIMTYSHKIDLALCDALLRHGTTGVGLIGSATKWARFKNRLSEIGHSLAEISKIQCPIGDPRLGKHPQAIALGVATQMLAQQDQQAESRGVTG